MSRISHLSRVCRVSRIAPIVFCALVLATLAGCTSGGGGGGGVAAPTGLSYPIPGAFLEGTAITPLLPTVLGGAPSQFAISPAPAPGLSFDPLTGELSGTPTAPAPLTSHTITASNAGGAVDFVLEISVMGVAPCGLTYSEPNSSYIQGEPIVANVPTVGCGIPTGYAVTPSLPVGLLLDGTTGVITGTPTDVTAAANYTVTASNATGDDSFDLTIAILVPPPCALAYDETDVIYLESIAIPANSPSSGCGAVELYEVSPALPFGLTFDTMTGVIAGTPTEVTPAAAYTVTASNSTGSDSVVLTIEISTPLPCNLTYSDPSPVYPPGAPIIDNILSVGCGGATAFSIDHTLPDGLVFDPTTGTISGTPTTFGDADIYTIVATNSLGSDSVELELRVDYKFTYSTPDAVVTYDLATGLALFDQTISIEENPANPGYPNLTAGASIALSHDPALITSLAVMPGASVLALNGGMGPDYFNPYDNGQGVTIGMIYDFQLVDRLSMEVPREVAVVFYEAVGSALMGNIDGVTTSLTWKNLVGVPPTDNLIPLDGNTTVVPDFTDVTIDLVPSP